MEKKEALEFYGNEIAQQEIIQYLAKKEAHPEVVAKKKEEESIKNEVKIATSRSRPISLKTQSSSVLGCKKDPPSKQIELEAKKKGIRKQQVRFEGEWECPKCKNMYTIKSNLINHIRKQHKNAEGIVKKIKTPDELEKINVMTKRFMNFVENQR